MTGLSQEQRLLEQTVTRLLEDHVGRTAPTVGGYGSPSPELWREFARLGLLGLPFAEEYGGAGLGLPEIAVAARAMGVVAATEPFVANIVLGGGLLAALGDDASRRMLLPRLSDGSLRVSFAHIEPHSRFNLVHVETQAEPAGNGFRLNGHKSLVLDGSRSDLILVSARTGGNAGDRHGISVFGVRPEATGVTVMPYMTVDGREAADVTLREVLVGESDLVGPQGGAVPAIERVVDEAIIVLCAEADGAIRRMNSDTIDYCRTRVAFGQPISKFQAIQHKLVDMEIASLHVGAITWAAAREAALSAHRRAMLASAAKAVIAREGMFVAKSAVQLHGAVGTTEDLPLGRLFKRIMTNATLFGGADPHQRRYYRLRRGDEHGESAS